MNRLVVVTFLICLLAGPHAQAAANKNFYSDGTITTGQEWNMVGIYDTPPAHTTVNMTGGIVWSLNVTDASTFNMSSGHVTGSLNAMSQSTINISDGAVLANVGAAAFSTLNVYDGTMSILDIQGATANLYGGNITSFLEAFTNSTVNIFGTGLAKTSTGGTFGDGQITGFWLNGPAFTINMEHPETYSHVNLVPEPATFLLLGLGGLSLRRRMA